MATDLDWSRIEQPYWKPTPDKEYIIEATNWRIVMKDFGKTDAPQRDTFAMDVVSVSVDGHDEFFTKPKEFATTNRTFIENIKPIIQKAVRENRDNVWIQLKKNNKGVYSVFTFHPPVAQYARGFPGVKSQ